MINFAKELNPQQYEVIQNGDGPCLVLAGAGSGKTRTITYRVAYLLEQGVKPENILLLTFTNKAAGEMVKRVQELTTQNERDSSIPQNDNAVIKDDSGLRLPYAGTFHSIANKILRHYATKIGYQSNFSILDTDDSKTLLKLCIKNHKPAEARKFPSVNIIQNTLSYAKNSGEDLEEVIELKCSHFGEFIDEFRKISFEYEKRKKESNSMDFDDLLINLNLLLDNSDTGKKFAEQFQYVLVDEYQDTNKIQSEIIDKFANVHKNILVVGDDAQSIYSFRAAQIENILNFENKYKDAKIFKLETNYRSSQEILDIANDVIENNLNQYKKQLRALDNSGNKPTLVPQSDSEEEARYIISKIRELNSTGIKSDNIAILFRASHHSQRLEMELVKNGMEYDYRGGMRFFERAHIKDVLAFLRILNNPKDTASWFRLLTHEEGVGPAAADKIIQRVVGVENIKDVLKTDTDNLSKKAKLGWQNFLSIFKNLLQNNKRDSSVPQNDNWCFPSTLIQTIIQSNYKNYLQNEYTDPKERMQDIEELANFSEKYSNLNEFLSEATLQEKHTRPKTSELSFDEEDKIILSTIHQAKGLEWDAVFIINLTSTGFPNERASVTNDGLEEERRLFYVATTRAKQQLFLTYPMEQSGWGERINEPSMFLGEISMDKIEDHSLLFPANSLALNELDDNTEDVKYVPDDYSFTPGSFLKDIDDL